MLFLITFKIKNSSRYSSKQMHILCKISFLPNNICSLNKLTEPDLFQIFIPLFKLQNLRILRKDFLINISVEL